MATSSLWTNPLQTRQHLCCGQTPLNPATSSCGQTPFKPSDVFVVVSFFLTPFEPSKILFAVGFFRTPFKPGDIFVAGEPLRTQRPLRCGRSPVIVGWSSSLLYCEADDAVNDLGYSPPYPYQIQENSPWVHCHFLANAMGSLLFYRLMPWFQCLFIGYFHGFTAFLLANTRGPFPFYWLLPWVYCHFIG